MLVLLLIEFLDEFVFGAREAAWPLVRDDLGLSYAQVGVLLSVPGIVANLVEPFLAVLGDIWRRRVIVLGGGAAFTLALGFRRPASRSEPCSSPSSCSIRLPVRSSASRKPP